MKFFTPEVYRSWYNPNPTEHILMAAHCQYHRYIESLQSVLPSHLIALTQLAGTDDGLIVKAHHDRDAKLLEITLRCGDLQMGYYDLVLLYEDAEISPQHEQKLAHIARTTKSDGEHESDLWVHEVDIAESGRFIHRLFFHQVWFEISCRDLQWEKSERPNRNLPRIRKRYTSEGEREFSQAAQCVLEKNTEPHCPLAG